MLIRVIFQNSVTIADKWATGKFDGSANAHPWLCLCSEDEMLSETGSGASLSLHTEEIIPLQARAV